MRHNRNGENVSPCKTPVTMANKSELSDFFAIVTGVLQGDIFLPFLFIICRDYVEFFSECSMDHKGMTIMLM